VTPRPPFSFYLAARPKRYGNRTLFPAVMVPYALDLSPGPRTWTYAPVLWLHLLFKLRDAAVLLHDSLTERRCNQIPVELA
jgi:hypothetical protein